MLIIQTRCSNNIGTTERNIDHELLSASLILLYMYLITYSNLLRLIVSFYHCSVPPLYFVFENSKNTRNELARPVMETIFLVYVGRSVCLSVGRYVCREPKCVGGITCPKHARAQSQFWAVKTDL